MKTTLLILFLLFSSLLHAQPLLREKTAVFSIKKDHLEVGGVQYGLEWLTPFEFNQHPLKKLDANDEIANDEYHTQVVVAKLAFISQKNFDQLSLEKLATKEVVKEMFDASFVEEENKKFPMKNWNLKKKKGKQMLNLFLH